MDTRLFDCLRATTGTPFKLISPKGTLLGVLTVPDDVADLLSKRGQVQFRLYRPIRFQTFREYDPANGLSPESYGIIARSYHQEFCRDGVHLFGVTIEETEKLPGWSFAPGAGYIRSLIA